MSAKRTREGQPCISEGIGDIGDDACVQLKRSRNGSDSKTRSDS